MGLVYFLAFVLCVFPSIAIPAVAATKPVAAIEADAMRCHHPLKVGYGGLHFAKYNVTKEANATSPLWTYKLEHTGEMMAYLTLHFEKLVLPSSDRLMLRTGCGNEMRISPPSDDPLQERSFYSPRVASRIVYLELYRDDELALSERQNEFSIYVDHYRCGANVLDHSGQIETSQHETVCGMDNSEEVSCLVSTPTPNEAEHQMFAASRTIARLLIHKEHYDATCTGWLVGCDGHLITNYHCVSSPEEAANTEFEFLAQGSSCESSCAKYGACRGRVVATSATLVDGSKELDFVLLKLNTTVNLTNSYGYLQMRNEDVQSGERIYIPQHPMGHGKRISRVTDDGRAAIILNTEVYQCGIAGVSYAADTNGGSSGSPVIFAKDNSVLALHHCGSKCSNTGVPMNEIVAHLLRNATLPPCGIHEKNTNLFHTLAQPNATFVHPNRSFNGTNIDALNATDILDNRIDLPMVRTLTRNGTLHRLHDHVTVDQVAFTLLEDGFVEIDVLSVEISDDVEYVDVNHDCQANYVDSAMYLFQQGRKSPVFYEDDTMDGGTADGSVSVRDPYRKIFLKQGEYILAIGSVPFTENEARLKRAARTKYQPTIYSCFLYGDSGHYQVSITTNVQLQITSEPEPSAPAQLQCMNKNEQTTCGREA